MFSGGALERWAIFALGIMPYISASIILQMARHVIPRSAQLSQGRRVGRRKMTQYTRYGTVLLGVVPVRCRGIALQTQGVVINPGPRFVFTAAITLVTGTMFLMWLGEQITERGIGNGISMIILSSSVRAFRRDRRHARAREHRRHEPGDAFLLGFVILGVTAFVVYIERAQRRIAVNYAKRQQGRRMYAGQTSHLPFKMNMSGVIPPIFASSLILFPATIASWSGTSSRVVAAERGGEPVAGAADLHHAVRVADHVLLLLLYGARVQLARDRGQPQQLGAFIPGIRPGQQTRNTSTRCSRDSRSGARCTSPRCACCRKFMILEFNVPFYFGGTSLLIIVVVTMDFMAQMQAHMMTHQYEGLLKKANLRGYGGKNT